MSIQLSSTLSSYLSVRPTIHPSFICFFFFLLSWNLPTKNFCPFQPLSPSQDNLAASSRGQSLNLDLVPLKLCDPYLPTTWPLQVQCLSLGRVHITAHTPPPRLAPWCFLSFVLVPLPSSAHPWLVHVLQPTCCQGTLLTKCSHSFLHQGCWPLGRSCSNLAPRLTLHISREQMLQLTETQFLDP